MVSIVNRNLRLPFWLVRKCTGGDTDRGVVYFACSQKIDTFFSKYEFNVPIMNGCPNVYTGKILGETGDCLS